MMKLLDKFPTLDERDTIVFLGDYIDRGPDSAQCVEYVRTVLPDTSPAKIVALRGNHEDAWLRVRERGWPEFLMPVGNGALACYRSYTGGPPVGDEETPRPEEWEAMFQGKFFPPEHVAWFESLPYWYEDEHAIYVHAGIPPDDAGQFWHPSQIDPQTALLWVRTESFFRSYRGKRVVIGHTTTDQLPQELSKYTPDDPSDLWAGEAVIALDTGCGKGGFLTAIELPALHVYESR